MPHCGELIFQCLLYDAHGVFLFLNFGRLSFSLTTLFKLSLLEAPGWDLAYVRQTIDISGVLDQLIHRFERTLKPTATQHDIDAAHDCFTQGARRLRRVREWLSVNSPTASSANGHPQAMNLGIPDFNVFDAQDSFHLFEDLSWQELG